MNDMQPEKPQTPMAGMPAPVPSKKSYFVLTIGISLFTLALVVAAFAAGTYFGQSPVENNTTDSMQDVTQDTSTTPDTRDNDVPEDSIALTIEWDDTQPTGVVNADLKDALYANDPAMVTVFSQKSIVLGTVRGGKYDGYVLSNQFFGQENLGEYYVGFYLLTPPSAGEKVVILDRYSLTMQSAFTRPFQNEISVSSWMSGSLVATLSETSIIDTSSIIPEFEAAQHVRDTEGNAYSFYANGSRDNVFTESDDPSGVAGKIGTLTSGETIYVYTAKTDGQMRDLPFIVRKDGLRVYYDVEIPFWSETGPNSMQLSIRWDGEKSTTYADYIKAEIGGCGFSRLTNVVDPADLPSLVEGGSIQGSKIYVPVSFDDAYYDDAFDSWSFNDEARTREEFAAIHPFFYYVDALGRTIQFQNVEAMPAAECGKPVIYLYPETKSNVDVSLAPVGGFTYTEPAYNGGWHVTAYPDGRLVNHADNETYPYLFWEGRGGLYSSPDQYWVVKAADVPGFLRDTLAKLGLNEQETADFMEFWVPKMQSAPYYKIGFYGTPVMNILAPLDISPAPDTVLRILMDYHELSAPEPSNPPKLTSAPKREGFTVIEWGGVLR